MTDGTTGFQVAPITEDEMNRVQSILKRAADAIVGMSQLHADVDMLRQTVASLQADADRLRSQNNALDEALNHSRSVRDEQGRKLAEVEADLHHMTADRDEQLRLANVYRTDIEATRLDLDLTRKARDDADFRNLELTESLAEANAKLAKIEAEFKDIFGWAKPEPMAVIPVPITETATPESTPELASAPLPDFRDDWAPDYYWDQATMKYWRNGVAPRFDGADIPY